MTMSKEFQRLEQRLLEIENANDRIETKLDALMKNNMKPEDLKKVVLPQPRKVEKISSAPPYRIKEQEPVSTIEVPEVETSEITEADPSADLEHKDTITPPEVPPSDVTPSDPTAVAEPVPGYDKLTEGEAIKLVKSTEDSASRSAIIDYEKSHRNRARVIEAGTPAPEETPPAV